MNAIVIFYQPDYTTKTIKEIGRTTELPYPLALDIYCETPNPASQLLSWVTDAEKEETLAQHKKDINNKEWLEELFNQI